MTKWEHLHDKIVKELQKIGEIQVDGVWIKKYDNQTYHALNIISPLRLIFGSTHLVYLFNDNYLRTMQYDMLSDKYLEKVLQGAIEAKKRGIK